MQLPDSVLRVLEKAAARHPTDIEAALEKAMRELPKLPDYAVFVDQLVRAAALAGIHDARHRGNTRILHDLRPKVRVAASEGVKRACADVYLYCIGGSVLGELTFAELPDLLADEVSKVKGHQRNVRLLEWLVGLGRPADRRVREEVTQKRLREVLRRLDGGEGLSGVA